MDGDYPKEISHGFAGIPNNINAAVWWHPGGEGYFFKGERIFGITSLVRICTCCSVDVV